MTIIDQGTRGANGNLLKYDRKIIVVTDGQGSMDASDLDAIADRLKEVEISMTLL
jgi:ATP-dependent DNA helicase 2 subunit 2